MADNIDVRVMVGGTSTMPMTDQDLKLRNIMTSFESESGQGRSGMIAGVLAIAVGWHTERWWIAAVGLVVFAYGYTRWQRAYTTRDKLQYEAQFGVKL